MLDCQSGDPGSIPGAWSNGGRSVLVTRQFVVLERRDRYSPFAPEQNLAGFFNLFSPLKRKVFHDWSGGFVRLEVNLFPPVFLPPDAIFK
jgi:hypothetical protein